MRVLALVVVVAVTAAACGDDPNTADDSDIGGDDPGISREFESAFPPAPSVPDGPLTDNLIADLDAVFSTLRGPVDLGAVHRLGQSGDARVAWLLSDILRFLSGGELSDTTISSWEALTGVTVERFPSPWGFTTDHLIAWDLPAPPGYIGWIADR